jgi:hypothetical protein
MAPGHDGDGDTDLGGSSFNVSPYVIDSDAALLSPEFEVPEASQLVVSWASLRQTEANYDFLTVEVSTDGGERFDEIARFDGTNDAFPGWDREEAAVNVPAGAGPGPLRVPLRRAPRLRVG